MSRMVGRCLLVFLGSCLSLLGQEEEPVPTQFSVMSWGGTIRGLYFWDEGERVDVTIHNGAPSHFYETALLGELTFYRDGPLNELGEVTAVTVGSVKIPPGTDDSLVVFRTGDRGKQEYAIFSVRTGIGRDGVDVYKVYNMTGFPMVAQFGSLRLELRAGGAEVIEAPGEAGEPSFPVAFVLKVPVGSSPEWKLAYRTEWVFREGRSSLVFVLEDPRRPGRVTVRKVYFVTRDEEVGEQA